MNKNWNQAAWSQHLYKPPQPPPKMGSVGEPKFIDRLNNCERCKGYHVCSCPPPEVRKLVDAGLQLLKEMYGDLYIYDTEWSNNDQFIKVSVHRPPFVGGYFVRTSALSNDPEFAYDIWRHARRRCIEQINWCKVAELVCPIMPASYANVDYNGKDRWIVLTRTSILPATRSLTRFVPLDLVLAAETERDHGGYECLGKQWQLLAEAMQQQRPQPETVGESRFIKELVAQSLARNALPEPE